MNELAENAAFAASMLDAAENTLHRAETDLDWAKRERDAAAERVVSWRKLAAETAEALALSVLA